MCPFPSPPSHKSLFPRLTSPLSLTLPLSASLVQGITDKPRSLKASLSAGLNARLRSLVSCVSCHGAAEGLAVANPTRALAEHLFLGRAGGSWLPCVRDLLSCCCDSDGRVFLSCIEARQFHGMCSGRCRFVALAWGCGSQ